MLTSSAFLFCTLGAGSGIKAGGVATDRGSRAGGGKTGRGKAEAATCWAVTNGAVSIW